MTAFANLELRIYWMTLFVSLPAGGVLNTFPTETACREQWIAVRWPSGVRCDKCRSDSVIWMDERDTYRCRDCRRQFSPTTGTILHRSRLPIRTWFRTAEHLIRKIAPRTDLAVPSDRVIGATVGVDHTTAKPMRKTILTDLAPGGCGLFREAICQRPVGPPIDVATNADLHLDWLLSQIDVLDFPSTRLS
ncbi:transposase [Jannaschia formosa]|uniref:transposase n=1 Tax=Jannaschia formosa TaxID=2259592 RepID=UPI000E1C0485|nr:transposase [Jannaschia formosa]TFL18461.1 hypothetical protein DR046_10240 [Jannaschia formosa]